MNFDAFTIKFLETIPAGTIFQNPGGGTSEVLSVKNGKVRYKRRNSTMAISLQALFYVYVKFRGRNVSSSDLKVYAPAIFDSAARPAGHSCNGTFLFLAFLEMKIVSTIHGQGIAGYPFFVEIPK